MRRGKLHRTLTGTRTLKCNIRFLRLQGNLSPHSRKADQGKLTARAGAMEERSRGGTRILIELSLLINASIFWITLRWFQLVPSWHSKFLIISSAIGRAIQQRRRGIPGGLGRISEAEVTELKGLHLNLSQQSIYPLRNPSRDYIRRV